MGALDDPVLAIKLEDVEPIPLAGGSWSRMVITQDRATQAKSSLGYSLFRPGSVTPMVKHEVEELAFVLQGEGEISLEQGEVSFGPMQALYIPAGLWHSVANTGEEDVLMVFSFPYPDYPPSERQ